MSDRTEIDALLDRRAIHDVVMRYCRGIDRLDEELVRSSYHDDSFDDHGTFKGGGWAFAEYVIAALRAVPQRTTHMICNELVELDGDTAHSESYFVAHHLIEGEDGQTLLTFHGRYVDRFERRDGEWRIAHRVVVKDWAEMRPFVEAWADDSPFVAGARSRDDLVYVRATAVSDMSSPHRSTTTGDGLGPVSDTRAASAPTGPAT